ncbi:hypothetical protein ACVWWH_003660 [Sinomonas sp. RB5]
MMGGPMRRGGLRVVAARADVHAGKVSLAAANAGTVPHELAILPLPAGQGVGATAVGPDGRVD